jgi:predicted TIM-barrel fold metal-dependent hydrolase
MSAVARNTPRTAGDTDRERPMNSPAFPMDPNWLPYHPWPRRPAFPLPDGTVDAHCHVFGPGRRFPYAAEREYTPCDAGKEDRVLWGTDWPHPNLKSHMPDGALVDFIPRIAPTEPLRRQLLVDNPARLYWGQTT